ncbi:MAG: hypothetical protein J0I84_13375 [Terrimonas sp.]|nr:hypothetical protein [Terrimonas sp.]OJY91639.1 MAG: hypothetical protein BGP13_07530 [Sphingobacteriales bacterium 40-81]
MKLWLAFILLLIAVTATITPCCTDDDCAQEITRPENHSHKETGTCSPFYSCSTCAASVDPVFQKLTVTDPPSILIEHTSFYLYRLGSYSSTLFQPPRIV